MNCVGASRPQRDGVDERLIAEFYSGKGSVGIGENERGREHNTTLQRGWYAYGSPTYHPVGYDVDQDGMPDAWERAYGLDSQNSDDHAADKDGDGYTNIEEYLAIAALC